MSSVRSAGIIPMLSYEDIPATSQWLQRAFGFREVERFADPDGVVSHAIMEFQGGTIMLGRPGPDYLSPSRHAQVCEYARKWSKVPFVIDGVLIEMEGVEAHYVRAQAAGARILSPLEDDETAGRRYRAEDLEGHRWMFSSRAALD